MFNQNIIPKYIQELSAYVPGRLMEDVIAELGLNSVIKLASNENSLGPSPKALAALAGALNGLARYGDADSRRIKETLAQKLKLPVEHFLIGNGSSEFILLLAHAILSPGLTAIMSKPSFTLYAKNTQASGAEPIEVPLNESFGHDLKAIKAKMTDECRLVFLDNPLNPTGAWLESGELISFIQALPDRCLLVLDEAYTDFCRCPRPDTKTLLATDRVIILRTFSKIYGLAGIRAAYALMSPELALALNKIRQPFNLNNLAQIGLLAALNDEDHLEQTLQMTWTGLDYYLKELPALGMTVYPTQANFIMAGLKKPYTADTVCRDLLKEGVIIRSLTSFGLPNHIRISAGLPEENQSLIEALKRVL